MFASLAPYCGLPMKVLLSNLWLFGGLLTKVLPKLNATAGGMVGTTCAFQTIEGGTNEKYCKSTAMLRNVSEEAFTALRDSLINGSRPCEEYKLDSEAYRIRILQ